VSSESFVSSPNTPLGCCPPVSAAFGHRLLARRWKNVHPLDHCSMWTESSLRWALEQSELFCQVEIRTNGKLNPARTVLNGFGWRDPHFESLDRWSMAVASRDAAELVFSARV